MPDTATKLQVPMAVVQKTMEHLRAGGERKCETMVLWLGSDGVVEEVYRPDQEVADDYFRVNLQSMRSLMRHIRRDPRMSRKILAQVHSHPEEAYHSRADDTWAITRRKGVLSLVLPYFGLRMQTDEFLGQAATFQLTADDRWVKVATGENVHIID